MPSKMVTDRQKAAAALSGTVDAFSEQAADAFLELLEPVLREGESLPDLRHLQRLLRRRLDLLGNRLAELDEAHRAELKEDARLRRQRDEAASELKTLVSRLRGVLEQTCGAGTCARVLNIEGRISRDPVVLHRIASRFAEGLAQGLIDDGVPLLPGVALDVSFWISLLEEPTTRLGEALELLSLEQPETIGKQVQKARAIQEYDRSYRATASIVESFLRYADHPEVAKKIRPKRQAPTPEVEETATTTLIPANDDAVSAQPHLPSAIVEPST